MKRILLTLGGLFVAAGLLSTLFIAPAVGDGRGERHERYERYDDDDDDHHEGREGRWRGWFGSSRLDVAPVNNPAYQEECGACHFAYQPGLLPARSWQRMTAALEDHFGENAELDAETAETLTAYLMENGADRADHRRSRGIAGSLRAEEAPLRISDTRYFQRQHHEIPERLVKGNEKVGSWSACDACHRKAAHGSYNEHEVNIPGVGRWDD